MCDYYAEQEGYFRISLCEGVIFPIENLKFVDQPWPALVLLTLMCAVNRQK